MTDAYATATYTTYALWAAAINAATATKLIAVGTWREGGKTVWYTVIAA
jgi:hypothetical protein